MELDEKVRVIDGPEEEDRQEVEMKAKKLGRISKDKKFKMMPKPLRKEKEKLGEEITELNNTYQEMFELALEQYGVDNIRDLPEDKKAEFFAVVDMALDEAKMAKKDHDGDGKVETSTAEYMGSRDKAIKKSMKKESFEDNEKRREKARADKAAGKYDKEGNRVKLRGFGPDAGKSNMSNPAARASLMKKEEFILDEDDLVLAIEEEMTTGWRPDMGHAGTQGTINLGGKEHNARKVPIKHYDEFKKKHPGSKVMFRGPRQGKQNTKKSNAHHFYIIHKKGGVKEEVDDSYVQQVNEYITSKQVRMAKGIANDPRHKGGDYTGAAEKMEKIKKGLSNHPAAKKALRQANEETELTFEEMTPAQKAERLKMIAQAHDRVLTGRTRDARRAGAAARKHMKDPKATKGMATTKKDEAMDEQVQKLRKMIKENNNKAEAYKLLAKILNTKTEGEQ